MLIPTLAVVTVVVLLGAFWGAYVTYERHCIGTDGKHRSFLLFLVAAVFCTYIGTAIVVSLVANAACTGEGVGCAVGVSLVAFPLASSISLAAFLCFWAQGGTREQNDISH